jgi:hypothetical protein
LESIIIATVVSALLGCLITLVGTVWHQMNKQIEEMNLKIDKRVEIALCDNLHEVVDRRLLEIKTFSETGFNKVYGKQEEQLKALGRIEGVVLQIGVLKSDE